MPVPSNAILETIDLSRLPTFPRALARLMEILDREAASWRELAEVIGIDSGLAARVLAAAGSVARRRAQAVVELEPALMLLGRDAVHTLAISASIYHVFNQFSRDSRFDLAGYWRHCLRCAAICRGLALATAYRSPEEAYLAGLTHDIGQLLLSSGLGERYTRLCADVADERSLPGVELEHLGTTHGDVGAWVIERWQLDSFIADAVRYHHASALRLASAHPLIRIVALAEALSTSGMTVADEAMLVFGLRAAEIEQILAAAQGTVDRVCESLGVAAEAEPAGVDAEIARRVGEAALVACARSAVDAGGDRDAQLAAARQSLTLVFGVRKAIFLLAADGGEALTGVRLAGDSGLVGEVTVPLASSDCAVTECLRQNRALVGGAAVSGIEVLPVADATLLRVLDEAAFLAQPLVLAGRVAGVLLIGGSFGEITALARRASPLKLFAEAVAQALRRERAPAGAAAKARMIAHEANNPLAIIKNYTVALRQRLAQDNPALLADLDIVNEEIDRVATIIRRFGEPAPLEDRRSCQANELIGSLLPLWERTLLAPLGIRVETRLGPGLPAVAADRSRLTQVLLNLVKNAVEAMPGGGVLAIATHDRINRDGAACVAIEIADSGPGIPAALLDRLFAPVVSDKNGEHAGLGLAICRDLLRELAGSISCRSGEKGGACFEILLPKA